MEYPLKFGLSRPWQESVIICLDVLRTLSIAVKASVAVPPSCFEGDNFQ
jgi:hypothetical protein